MAKQVKKPVKASKATAKAKPTAKSASRASKPAAKASKVGASKSSAGKSVNSTPKGTKLAKGNARPVAKMAQKAAAPKSASTGKTKKAVAIGAAAISSVAVGVAASKLTNSKSSSSRPIQSARGTTMPVQSKIMSKANLKESQNGKSGATKNAPPMKLGVNDAEILASAKERYGAKDLAMFKKLLTEQRAEASEEFDIISEQILDTSGEFDADNQNYALHSAEQGTDAIEREKTFLHAQRTSDYIKKLDEALARIDRGTYGICVVCGGLIEKQRLAAVPITQKHVDCKNRTQAKKLSVDQVNRQDYEEPAAE